MKGNVQFIKILFFVLLSIITVTASTGCDGGGGGEDGGGATFLSYKYLQGSMQGKSGIALDLNGDGNDDLVIGAPHSQYKNSLGAVLVYLSTPRGFSSVPSAILEGEGNLGWSLAALGYMDSDGKGYFAAGAVNNSGENVSHSGTVAVYKGDDKPQKVAVLEGENAMDRFGYALVSGDLNSDGNHDLIVGAPMHSPSPDLYQQGAVYVYFGPNFNQSSSVKIAATEDNKGIGFSLATGDINNDGVDDLLMEASSKVIVYYGGDSFPSTSPDVVFTSNDRGFGRAIGVLWDIDNDGFREVAVGAYRAVIEGVNETGSLFIMKGGSGTRTVNADDGSPDRLAKIKGELNFGWFASVILPLEDVNGNNILLVSALHADGSLWPMTGKIFLFSGDDLTQGTPAVSVKSIPGEARDMHLGSFLALVSGNRGKWLAAGAPTENDNIGSVRLFDLSPFLSQ